MFIASFLTFPIRIHTYSGTIQAQFAENEVKAEVKQSTSQEPKPRVTI